MQAIITTTDQEEVRAVIAEIGIESQIQSAHGCSSRVCVTAIAPGQYLAIENNGGRLTAHLMLNATQQEAFDFIAEREREQGYTPKHRAIHFQGAEQAVNN